MLELVCAVGVLCGATGVAGPGPHVADGWEDAAARISAHCRSMRDEHVVPGIGVSVVVGDEIVFSAGFGKSDLEQDVAVTRETKFRLGSVSKLITAAVAARLADRGEVVLDADVREYEPEFPEKAHVVTLRQLLGHQSGVRHYTFKDRMPAQAWGSIDVRPYVTKGEVLDVFADDALLFEPGTKYTYSTFAFTLVSEALEGASGESFDRLIADEVLDVIGIGTPVLDRPERIIEHRTRFYDRTRAGHMINASFLNPAYKWAGGGMISTADDLAAFGAAHFGPGFLSEDAYAETFTRQSLADGSETNVGLTWRIDTDEHGDVFYHHGGAQQGCRAFLIVWPEHGVSVAVLSNLGGMGWPAGRLAHLVSDEVLAELAGSE